MCRLWCQKYIKQVLTLRIIRVFCLFLFNSTIHRSSLGQFKSWWIDLYRMFRYSSQFGNSLVSSSFVGTWRLVVSEIGSKFSLSNQSKPHDDILFRNELVQVMTSIGNHMINSIYEANTKSYHKPNANSIR